MVWLALKFQSWTVFSRFSKPQYFCSASLQSVTLGDEEASRRGVQKTVLERKGPSTFTCGVEIISKTELRVHRSLEATVDALLSGRPPKFEVRKISAQGFTDDHFTIQSEPSRDISTHMTEEFLAEDPLDINAERASHSESTSEYAVSIVGSSNPLPVRLFAYGILETSVVQAIKQMRMGDAVELTDNVSDADAFLALHAKLKKNSRIQAVAKSRDIPVYVTKTSSLEQIMKAIRSFMSKHADGFKDFEAEDKPSSSEKIDALEEARLAVEQVVIPKGEVVELLPRSSHIISLQMDLIQKYQLQSEKVGKEPDVRLRILPQHTGMEERTCDNEMVHTGSQFTDFSSTDDVNGTQNGMARLPLLFD